MLTFHFIYPFTVYELVDKFVQLHVYTCFELSLPSFGWLYSDLRRFRGISAISRLGSRR